MGDQNLKNEAERVTELLHGKVVRAVWRHRAGEVGLEFTDGTRFFVDALSSGGLDLSVTLGADDQEPGESE